MSELCFGTMTFAGTGMWKSVGQQQQDEANELIKTAFDAGVNFYDTANVYSEGKSEQILGKALKDLGINRQEVVIATKLRGRMGPGANQVGLSRLHIHDAINDSLKRLDLDHVDLLYIHGVDAYTPLEETMRGLEEIVQAGKVRYIGVSNHAAWHIVKANMQAKSMGWHPFVACQHFYSLATRDIERELIPMMEDQKMALMPWSPLAGGYLSGKFTEGGSGDTSGARRSEFDFPPIDKDKADRIVKVMREIADAKDVSVPRIALAWLLHQGAVTSVIIGAKNRDQLTDNLASTEVELTEDDLSKLDEVSALAPEYPQWMFETQGRNRFPDED